MTRHSSANERPQVIRCSSRTELRPSGISSNGGERQKMAETMQSTTKSTASSNPATAGGTGQTGGNPIAQFFRATEIDTRLLGMVAALLIIWVGFHIYTDGLFLTPRNLWNLSVQTTEIAV